MEIVKNSLYLIALTEDWNIPHRRPAVKLLITLYLIALTEDWNLSRSRERDADMPNAQRLYI